MRIFKDTNYDFIGKRKAAYFISITILVIGIVFFVVRKGFNWGVDFQGGIKLQILFEKPLENQDIEKIRANLQSEVKSLGQRNRSFIVQKKLPDFIREKEILINNARRDNIIFSDYEKAMEYLNIPDVLKEDFIRMFKLADEEEKPGATNINIASIDIVKAQISNLLTQEEVDNFNESLMSMFPDNKPTVEGISLIGPTVGRRYQQAAFLSLLFAIIGILIYISFRFEFIYSIGAIIALIHDVLIVLTVFVILNQEINLPVIVAVLTIIGYSLNDTIVVDDRIREARKFSKGSLAELINEAINSTLSRTFLTSLTTFVVVFTLYLFAGEALKGFSLAFLVGIVTGTYSSIFIAAPVILELEGKKQ